MKVSGIGGPQATSQTRRSERKEAARPGEFARHLAEVLDGLEEARGVEVTIPVAGVDALLAAQSVGDATDREARRRLAQRGEEILDRLDALRHGLLLGTLSKDALANLAQLVRSRRETVTDPGLATLLDEIELRAEVELAKLARAGQP